MQSHISKAEHNEKFLSFIEENNSTDFNDWSITVSFYAALHYMKAFIKKKLNKSSSIKKHEDLDLLINPNMTSNSPLDETTYLMYHELYTMSRTARYETQHNQQFAMALMKVNADNAKQKLIDIKKYLKKNGLKLQ